MLDISAANAFKTYIKLKPESNIEKKDVRRRLFLIELGQALCRQILPDFVRISSNKGFFRVEEFVFHIYFAIWCSPGGAPVQTMEFLPIFVLERPLASIESQNENEKWISQPKKPLIVEVRTKSGNICARNKILHSPKQPNFEIEYLKIVMTSRTQTPIALKRQIS